MQAEAKILSAKLEEDRSEVKTTHVHLDKLNENLNELSNKLNTLRKETESKEKKEGKK